MGALAIVQSPHDFIGGVYPAKVPDKQKVFQTRNVRESASQNLIETDGVPGGFFRIKRKALERMKEAYPEMACQHRGYQYHLLFEHIILEDRTPLGEDYAFCERWRRMGEKIFIYPDIDFKHCGRGVWEGNMISDDPRLNIVE